MLKKILFYFKPYNVEVCESRKEANAFKKTLETKYKYVEVFWCEGDFIVKYK